MNEDNVDNLQNKQPTKEESKAAANKGKGSVDNKRGLRRKFDNDDILMRRIKLDAFEGYKQSLLFRDDFMQITSFDEIRAIRELFKQRTSLSQKAAAAKSKMMEDGGKSASAEGITITQVPPISLLNRFEEILVHCQDKNVFYVARNLLRFVIDGEGKDLLKESLGYEFFRLYMLIM